MDTPTGKYVVDYKEYGKSYSVNRDNWGKICQDSLKVDMSSEPVLKLVIDDGLELAVIDWSWFMALINKEI